MQTLWHDLRRKTSREAAGRCGSINIMFEERPVCLFWVTLERIAVLLSRQKNIRYELIGGGAVMVHVQRVEPSAVRNTKGIDIMILRTDLERIKRSGSTPWIHVSGMKTKGAQCNASDLFPARRFGKAKLSPIRRLDPITSPFTESQWR